MPVRPLRSAVLALGAAVLTVGSALVTGLPGAAAAVRPSAAAGPSGLVSSTPTAGWVPNNSVHALATDGTWIYLGGTFTQLTKGGASQSATGMARVSVTTGAIDPTWLPKVNGDIRAMTYDAAKKVIYLGGDFTTINGTARTRIGAVSTTGKGATSTWYPGAADGEVRAILATDASTLLIGGKFLHIGGVSHTHLVKVSTAGAVLAGFTPKFSSDVFALAHPAGATFVVVGGSFTAINGQARNALASVSIANGAPTTWNPASPCGPNSKKACPVFSLAISTTTYFAAAGGAGGHSAAYNATTGAQKWRVGSDGDNQTIALSGSLVYIGGHFGPGFAGNTRCSIAAVDAATGKINQSFAPTCKSPYPGNWALLITAKGDLAVGGDVNHFNNTNDSKFAVFPAV